MLQIGFYSKITVLRLQLLFFYTAFIMIRLNICSMHQRPLSSTLHFFHSVNTMLSWKHHLCKGLVPTLHRQIATHDHVESVYDVMHLSYLTVNYMLWKAESDFDFEIECSQEGLALRSCKLHFCLGDF